MTTMNLLEPGERDQARTFAFYHEPDKEATGDPHLMTQSLIIQAPFRRIRHPELTPITPRERDERDVENLMTQSLIMAPFRRMRHAELTPVLPRGRDALLAKVIHSEPPKLLGAGPKRAFSMTRLDQLARPRQRYLEESLKLRASVTTKDQLVSPTRPTSSLSTACKLGVLPTPATVPYRPLASARKPRPISIAGTMLDSPAGHHQQLHAHSPAGVNTATIERPSRSSARTKLAFGQTSQSSRAQSAGSIVRPSTLALDLSIGQARPTPPRKPAHVKAASAARKLAKQAPESERPLKKAESTSRLAGRLHEPAATTPTAAAPHHQHSQAARSAEHGVRSMRKSATNPEKISATLSLPEDADRVATTAEPVGDLLGEIQERPNSESKSAGDQEANRATVDPQHQQQALDASAAENMSASTRKEISQQEYRRAMAERRRLAREQAEREAEQERQRLELEAAAEEERQRQEEEDHRRLVQEQELLHEEYRRQEEERLRKHQLELEEQQRREQDERASREEEQRARDEQERKNREKAEKARLELEERLRKDEEERIARKKRLEAIMSRTRKTPGGGNGGQKSSSPNSEGSHTPEQQPSQRLQALSIGADLTPGSDSSPTDSTVVADADSTTTNSTSTTVDQFVDTVHNRLVLEQNQLNEQKQHQLVDFGTQIKPDVVEDAIKSNLINGKSPASNKEAERSPSAADGQTQFVDNLLDFGQELNGGQPLLGKVSQASAFAFSAQTTTEAFTPGAN